MASITFTSEEEYSKKLLDHTFNEPTANLIEQFVELSMAVKNGERALPDSYTAREGIEFRVLQQTVENLGVNVTIFANSGMRYCIYDSTDWSHIKFLMEIVPENTEQFIDTINNIVSNIITKAKDSFYCGMNVQIYK